MTGLDVRTKLASNRKPLPLNSNLLPVKRYLSKGFGGLIWLDISCFERALLHRRRLQVIRVERRSLQAIFSARCQDAPRQRTPTPPLFVT